MITKRTYLQYYLRKTSNNLTDFYQKPTLFAMFLSILREQTAYSSVKKNKNTQQKHPVKAKKSL